MTPALSDAMTASSSQVGPPTTTASDQCGCGHLDQAHDVIAARFCAATIAAALTRACICHTAPTLRKP